MPVPDALALAPVGSGVQDVLRQEHHPGLYDLKKKGVEIVSGPLVHGAEGDPRNIGGSAERSTSSTSTYTSLWTLEETKALIVVWGQANVESQLDSVVRNRTIYQRIAKELADLGLNKTWEQCKIKIKNMTKKYNKV